MGNSRAVNSQRREHLRIGERLQWQMLDQESLLGGTGWGPEGKRGWGFPQSLFTPFSPLLFSSSPSPLTASSRLMFSFPPTHPSPFIFFCSFPLLNFLFPQSIFLPSPISPFPPLRSPFPQLQSNILFHRGRHGWWGQEGPYLKPGFPNNYDPSGLVGLGTTELIAAPSLESWPHVRHSCSMVVCINGIHPHNHSWRVWSYHLHLTRGNRDLEMFSNCADVTGRKRAGIWA